MGTLMSLKHTLLAVWLKGRVPKVLSISALLYRLRRVAGYGHKLWQLEICPIM